MSLLTFEQRNRLKVELYSGVTLTRKREIIRMLEADEEQQLILDSKSELGDEDL